MAFTKKAPFEWDYEHHLGFHEVHSHEQREVKRCKKDGKDYIVITQWKWFGKKGEEAEWHPVKGMTIPAILWEGINEQVQANLEVDPPTSLMEQDEEDEEAE
jgi:hypothetical protein